MRGEVTALISVISFAISFIYVNRAQIKGETSDNGLLPQLVLSTILLIFACLVRGLMAPTAFRFVASWRIPILYCVLSGVCWNFLSRMTLLASIARIGATRGIVMKSISPMLTVAVAIVFVHERMDFGDVLGFVCMMASIALLILEKTKGEHRSLSIVGQGIILGLLAALFQSAGHLLRKMGSDTMPPLLGVTLDVTAATLAYVVYLVCTQRLAYHVKFYIRSISRDVLAASLLATLGVVTSFVSISSASISTVAMILGMQPIFVPLLSLLFFPDLEKFTWASYLSAALVAGGVVSIMMYG